jgi:hypothetical protein
MKVAHVRNNLAHSTSHFRVAPRNASWMEAHTGRSRASISIRRYLDRALTERHSSHNGFLARAQRETRSLCVSTTLKFRVFWYAHCTNEGLWPTSIRSEKRAGSCLVQTFWSVQLAKMPIRRTRKDDLNRLRLCGIIFFVNCLIPTTAACCCRQQMTARAAVSCRSEKLIL